MLSYQHAYHAGNPADVHKHAVLAELLTLLTAKDRGISYVETHAGRGLYDVSGEEALKTGEAAQGIAQVSLNPDAPYAQALAAVRAQYGQTAYPGSPLIARHLLRPQDHITLMELHPAEHKALTANLPAGQGGAPNNPQIACHFRDGYEGVLALSPLTPRRGLVLIDPSYEVKSEYDQVVEFVRALHVKWPEAAIVVWYPVLRAGRHHTLLEGLSPLKPTLSAVAFSLKQGRGMTGSGLIIINPPFRTSEAIGRALRLGQGVVHPVE